MPKTHPHHQSDSVSAPLKSENIIFQLSRRQNWMTDWLSDWWGKSVVVHGIKLTFRLLLHVSRMFSILLMFSSEMNISVTANSCRSGLFDLDLPDCTCSPSGGTFESTDAMLDDCPAVLSAGGQKAQRNLTVEVFLSISNRNKLNMQLPITLSLFFFVF